MWSEIATIGAKLATLANNAFSYFAKKDDQNTGRKLQTADDLAASLNGDRDAAKTREAVSALTDEQLNSELSGRPVSPDKR